MVEAQRRISDKITAVSYTETTKSAMEHEPTSYLLLRLHNEHYALTSTYVREIARWRTPTPVPGAPPVLPGIINQRGVVLPVVQLSRVLGLPETPPDRSTRYLITRYEDIDMALLVDTVVDLVDLTSETREAVPDTLPAQQARLLQAIYHLHHQPVALLDLAEIITMIRGEG